MTQISATVIADSIGEHAPRLTTLEWVYPRWIHAEGRTHRVLRELEGLDIEVRTPSPMEDPALSRNAASSRAIPVKRMIADVLANPAVPLWWGANEKGMQSTAELTGEALIQARATWFRALGYAVSQAERLAEIGAHKQLVNRILEPFTHIKVVVSGTKWSNFLALRLHKDAEPHIRMLAEAARDALAASSPKELEPGQWHVPYVRPEDFKDAAEVCDNPEFGGGMADLLLPLSVARCASVSYDTVDGFKMTLERACALYQKLVGSTPMHASPTEHQATPQHAKLSRGKVVFKGDHGGNFGPAWVQLRKTLKGECQ